MAFSPTDKGQYIVLSNDKYTATKSGGAGYWSGVRGATSLPSTGKYYFEFYIGSVLSTWLGVAKSSVSLSASPAQSAAGLAYIYSNAATKSNGDGTTQSYGTTFAAGDTVGVAVNADSGSIWFSKNNTWQAGGAPDVGTNPAYSTMSGTFFPAVFVGSNGSDSITLRGISANAYSPPSGFTAVDIPSGVDVFVGALLAFGNPTVQAAHTAAGIQYMRL